MSHKHSQVKPPLNDRVLFVGLRAESFSAEELAPLNMTMEELAVQIERGWEAVEAQGVAGEFFGISKDPDEAEAQLRKRFAEDVFGIALIGGGVRLLPDNTVLLERIVNVLIDVQPEIRLSFNTSPQNALDAIRRWTDR